MPAGHFLQQASEWQFPVPPSVTDLHPLWREALDVTSQWPKQCLLDTARNKKKPMHDAAACKSQVLPPCPPCRWRTAAPSPATLGSAWSGALETWWGNKSSSNCHGLQGQCVVSLSFAAMEGSGAPKDKGKKPRASPLAELPRKGGVNNVLLL